MPASGSDAVTYACGPHALSDAVVLGRGLAGGTSLKRMTGEPDPEGYSQCKSYNVHIKMLTLCIYLIDNKMPLALKLRLSCTKMVNLSLILFLH